MHILFRTAKLKKEFESAAALQRNRGSHQATLIKSRMAQLEAAASPAALQGLPGRFHCLRANHPDWMALCLDGSYRLIFVCGDDAVPRTADGGVALDQIRTVCILGVIDYHGDDDKRKPI